MSQFSKTSLFYSVMRVYSNLIYRKWFSTIEINGENNIPQGEPVIFAPNHQNGFIDAMALLSSSPQPVVFWVRADLFNNKVIGKILRSLKMMPAYRMRNGFSNLKKNEESMCDSDDVLTHSQFLCLMPEGGQDEKRTLRPLVKGIFRSAFSAQEKMPKGKHVSIIPTGIDYGHYDKSGRHLIVNFGKPINIEDYLLEHEENAPVALNNIKEELSKRMEPLMLNITSKEHYNSFYIASYLFNSVILDRLNLPDNETNRLIARKRIIETLEKAENSDQCIDLVRELDEQCKLWDKNHKDTCFCARIQEEGEKLDTNLITQLLYLILFSPLMLYALLINGLGFAICKYLGNKKHGSGFEASIKFGAAGVLFPIIYLIEMIIASFVFTKTSTFIAFIFTLPLSFMFMQRYRLKYQYVKERIRNIIQKPKEPMKVNTIMQNICSIIGCTTR